jgi:hypothetical protein
MLEAIQGIERTEAQNKRMDELEAEITALQMYYMSLDEEEIKMINRALEKKYDSELKEESERRKKLKRIALSYIG